MIIGTYKVVMKWTFVDQTTAYLVVGLNNISLSTLWLTAFVEEVSLFDLQVRLWQNVMCTRYGDVKKKKCRKASIQAMSAAKTIVVT